jgi:ABC-type bacteriocin/lantibiotic exporter with double-glycine peptidase domain
MHRDFNPFRARTAFVRAPQSLAGKLFSLLIGALMLVLAVMFSLVALAIVAVGGSLFAGWLWWKTRAVRKAMREAAPIVSGETQVIEGEFMREADQGDPRLRD